MSQDLNVADLQEETVVVDEAKAQKAQEKMEAQIAGGETLKGMSVSENMVKCINLAQAWVSGDEAKAQGKLDAIEAFGGVEALKAFATTEMTAELEVYKNIDKTLSVLNSVKHFYAKRKNSTSSKKVATTRIKIADDFYSVSTAYLAEIADEDSATKRELVLAHADTNKEAITEL